jgi:hypothetical protein
MFRNNWFKVTSLGVVLFVVLTACTQAQASAPAASTTLDNPNDHWIGPETIAAAQKQLDTVPTTGGTPDAILGWMDAGASSPTQGQAALPLTTGGSGDHWIGPETVAAADKQLDSVPTTGGVIDATGGWRDAGAGSATQGQTGMPLTTGGATSDSCQVVIPSGWGSLSGQVFEHACTSNP